MANEQITTLGALASQRQKEMVDKTFSPESPDQFNYVGAVKTMRAMMSNLKSRGLSKPSLFETRIITPIVLQRIISDNLLTLACEKSTFPGQDLQTTELRTYGPLRKIPYNRGYQDVTLVYRLAEDMLEKMFWESWHNAIFDKNTHNMAYYDDYTTEIDIIQMKPNGDPIYSVRLFEAYPSTILPIELQESEQNSYSTISVTISYRYWLSTSVQPTPSNIKTTPSGLKTLTKG